MTRIEDARRGPCEVLRRALKLLAVGRAATDQRGIRGLKVQLSRKGVTNLSRRRVAWKRIVSFHPYKGLPVPLSVEDYIHTLPLCIALPHCASMKPL